MKTEPITKEKIDELLHFLPLFDMPEQDDYIERWAGGEKRSDGVITMPYSIYSEEAARFFRLAGQAWWLDYDYKPVEAATMLQDMVLIEQATFEQIKTMLTYCVRGERFSEGHWAEMLRSGRITAILKRLRVLRDLV